MKLYLIIIGSAVILLALLIFFAVVADKIAKNRAEKALMDYQNKLVSTEMQEVQNLYMKMRGWRHDYHNHLQSVKAYLANGDVHDAKNYLDELETDLDDIQLLFDTGNINVDAILNAKVSLALENGIRCDYTAHIPEKLTVSDIDLAVLIGNLIDNAVEACRTVKREEQFLRIYIAPFKQQLYISVSNATSELVRKLDEEYISGKRGDHGHGLKRINNTVEKYGGYINRKNEPGVFVTEIMLPL